MKLKPKPKMYEVTYSLRKNNHEWSSTQVPEDQLLNTIMVVLANTDYQLECVALLFT